MVLKSIFDEELMELLGFEVDAKKHDRGGGASAAKAAAGAGVHSVILVLIEHNII